MLLIGLRTFHELHDQSEAPPRSESVVSQTSFRMETKEGVAKYRLFSQATHYEDWNRPVKNSLDPSLP